MPLFTRAMVAVLGSLAAGLSACTAPTEGTAGVLQSTRSADGVVIRYTSAGAGEPALIFVHGWCGTRALWSSTVQAFAPRERVVALDLAGHGDSGAGRTTWSLAALADDVVSVVEDCGAREVILVGHSMGAPVALLAAARLAPRVRGVIGVESLHDVAFRYEPGFLERVERDLRADFPRALEASLRSVAAPSLDAEHLHWLVEAGLRTRREAALGLLRGLEGFSLEDALRAAGVPVRAINAAPRGKDGLPTALERNRQVADFQALLLEDCGHFPMLEQPAPFRAALLRCVEELASRAP